MIAKWAIRINKMIVLNVTPPYCSHLNAVYMYNYVYNSDCLALSVTPQTPVAYVYQLE